MKKNKITIVLSTILIILISIIIFLLININSKKQFKKPEFANAATSISEKLEYKEKAIDYINEFYEYNSEINGSGSLDRFLRESTYEAWLQKLIGAIDIANIPQGKVPGLTYFYVREVDDRIVGMINIRLATSDIVRTEVGHMGYSIRPAERRKHYGTQMLREALEFCKPLRLN